jgi:hypothetical protein
MKPLQQSIRLGQKLKSKLRLRNLRKRLPVLAHTIFGLTAIYFAYLFFHLELSFAFVRNLGVAVTIWTSFGVAFNFATVHSRAAAPWFTSLNVVVLGTDVLLCLLAMANHADLVIHAIVIHGVLSLNMMWNFVAHNYYRTESRVWTKWYDEQFKEDVRLWGVYLCTGYLPFVVSGFAPRGSFPSLLVEGVSDGVTASILFFEFFAFWMNMKKERDLVDVEDDKPLPSKGEVLKRIIATRELRVGCFYWPPVVDCLLEQGTNSHIASGFYGKWLSKVAANNNLRVTYLQSEWHKTEQQLKEREIDLLLCAFITDTRRKYADFSRAFHQCAMHGVARVGGRLWDVDALKEAGVKIVIAKNEVGFEFVTATLGFDPHAHDSRFTVVTTSKVEEVASIVLGGTPDYVAIADALSIHNLQQRYKRELRIVLDKPPLKTYDVAIMFLKGQTDFKKWIDDEFVRARADQEIAQAERELIEQLDRGRFFRKL